MIQAVQDIALSLSKGIADFKCSMEAISTEHHTDTFGSLQSDDEHFDLPKSVVDASESIYTGECAEQMLVEYVGTEDGSLTPSSYMAAITLARSSKRPDVVLPYLGRWMDLFYEAGFPTECHGLVKEIFAAAVLYGRVPTLGFNEISGVLTHLRFHDRGDE